MIAELAVVAGLALPGAGSPPASAAEAAEAHGVRTVDLSAASEARPEQMRAPRSPFAPPPRSPHAPPPRS